MAPERKGDRVGPEGGGAGMAFSVGGVRSAKEVGRPLPVLEQPRGGGLASHGQEPPILCQFHRT